MQLKELDVILIGRVSIRNAAEKVIKSDDEAEEIEQPESAGLPILEGVLAAVLMPDARIAA
jgi:hypothetical protein